MRLEGVRARGITTHAHLSRVRQAVLSPSMAEAMAGNPVAAAIRMRASRWPLSASWDYHRASVWLVRWFPAPHHPEPAAAARCWAAWASDG